MCKDDPLWCWVKPTTTPGDVPQAYPCCSAPLQHAHTGLLGSLKYKARATIQRPQNVLMVPCGASGTSSLSVHLHEVWKFSFTRLPSDWGYDLMTPFQVYVWWGLNHALSKDQEGFYTSPFTRTARWVHARRSTTECSEENSMAQRSLYHCSDKRTESIAWVVSLNTITNSSSGCTDPIRTIPFVGYLPNQPCLTASDINRTSNCRCHMLGTSPQLQPVL